MMNSLEAIEKTISVILRIPSLFIVDLWFFANPHHSDNVYVGILLEIASSMGIMALMVAVVVATLPLRHCVTFYIYMVCAGLMVFAGMESQSYVTVEELELKEDLEAAMKGNITLEQGLSSLLKDYKRLGRLFQHLDTQLFIAVIVAYLIEIKNWLKFTLLAFALPMVARLMGFPAQELHLVHFFATIYTILLFLFCIFKNLGYIINVCKVGIEVAFITIPTFGIWPVVLNFSRNTVLPVQLFLYWSLTFVYQIYVHYNFLSKFIGEESWLLVFLDILGKCCLSPARLLAFCITITYTSRTILCFTKLYLLDLDAFEHNTVTRSSEGYTMFLMSIVKLVGHLEMQRAFLMSILLFIVGSSFIQSMYEITDPVLLALSASHNPSVFKHVKAVALSIVLLILPLYMTYVICQYFYMDFWFLFILSSSLLTSVRVAGSLIVYMSFMYDFMRSEPWDNLDNVIYCARAVPLLMEFIVLTFAVCFTVEELINYDWSLDNFAIFLLVHYFNVWQNAQSDWKSFLLRWEAAKKVESLPQASEEQLARYDDVCAICCNEMTTACITPCEHMFHCACLRKWLYVKETCPICRRYIVGSPSASGED